MNRWVLGARPRTLPAAVVPVWVGTVVAATEGNVVHSPIWWRACAAMVVALALQVATNYANDYSDGKRGTDDPEKRVGPPRLVGNGLASPGEVKRAMLVAFGVAGAAGLTLVAVTDWRVIFVGAAAIAAGWFYTGGPRPYGYAGFGEVFVFVFFGLVATVGAAYVQNTAIAPFAWWAGICCGCFATSMLVANNLRDIASDREAGKITLAVRLGDRATRFLFCALLLFAVVVAVLAGLAYGYIFAPMMLALLIPTLRTCRIVVDGASGPALIAVLGRTGQLQLGFAVLMTFSLLLSSV